MGFKRKLYLLNFLSAVVPIILISFVSYYLLSSKLEDQENTRIHTVGLSIEKNIYEKIKEAELAIDVVMSDITSENIIEVKKIFNEGLEKNNDLSIKETNDFLKYRMELVSKGQKDIKSISYGKENKEILVGPREDRGKLPPGYDPTIRPWYTGAIKSKGYYISNIYLSAIDKTPMITVSKRVEKNNKVEGVLLAILDLSTISRYLSSYDAKNNKSFVILNKETKIYLGNKSDISFLENNKNLNVNLFLDKDRKEQIVIDGTVYYSRDLDVINSVLITYISESELYKSLIQIRVISIILILLTLLLIHIMLLLLGKLFNKSLDRLSYILHSISRGNYSKNIDKLTNIISDGSELSIIKDAIKNMHFEIVKRENELKYMSEVDELTKIYNRRAFLKFLEMEVDKSRRTGSNFVLVMFDLDKFKNLNDNFGHLFGDEVLRKIGEVIPKNIRKTDYFGRYGGEEFMIILTDSTISKGVGVTTKLRKIVESLIWKYDIKVTISMGVIENTKGDTVDKMIERVDKLLYEAKENGRNRVEY